MRVIRTEMYFDDVNGLSRHPRRWLRRGEENQNPGLGFAWFRSDQAGPFNFGDDKQFEVEELPTEQIDDALDMLLQDREWFDFKMDLHRGGFFPREGIQNPGIIAYVHEQSIVIEQSPPAAVRFKELLKRTNAPVYIGAYMGYAAAHEMPALMFLTVPLGIMVIGPAMGVSEALAIGLNKRIQQMFERRRKK
jgi:hypothetical protein